MRESEIARSLARSLSEYGSTAMPIYGKCHRCGYRANFYELRKFGPVDRVGSRNFLVAGCPRCAETYTFDPLPGSGIELKKVGRRVVITGFVIGVIMIVAFMVR